MSEPDQAAGPEPGPQLRVLTRGRVWLVAGTAALLGGVVAALLIPGAAPKAGGVSAEPGATASDLSRVPWEGGSAYYGRFRAPAAAGWTDPAFFPLGVWFESVLTQSDVDLDKAAGLNTYVELTENSDMSLVRDNAMFAMLSKQIDGYGAETVGWLLSDEVDMWAGRGDGGWTGNQPGAGEPCDSAGEGCGYTVLRTLTERLPPADGRMRYTNYGKGVMMWLPDADAERFVNQYTDLVSTDIYWYTDANICAEAGNSLGLPPEECRRASSYGATVDRTRELDARDGRRQPVLAFVQVGWPGEDDDRGIEPGQIAGAVMNSLIHEARGIVYFNHNFGGPCITQHVLRDRCGAAVRPTVAEINRRITALAPVLNTQSYRYSFNTALDTMLKEHDGSCYLFAMLGRGSAPGEYVFTMPARLRGATVEVLYENRTARVEDGRFTDSFDTEYDYHIYKITP